MNKLLFGILAVTNLSFGLSKTVECQSTDANIKLGVTAEFPERGNAKVEVKFAGAPNSIKFEAPVVQTFTLGNKLRKWEVSHKEDGFQSLTVVASDTVVYSAKYFSVDRFAEDRLEVNLKCNFKPRSLE